MNPNVRLSVFRLVGRQFVGLAELPVCNVSLESLLAFEENLALLAPKEADVVHLHRSKVYALHRLLRTIMISWSPIHFTTSTKITKCISCFLMRLFLTRQIHNTLYKKCLF